MGAADRTSRTSATPPTGPRRPTLAVAAGLLMVSVTLAGCTQNLQNATNESVEDLRQRIDELEGRIGPPTGIDVRVVQEEGGVVYWVLPGPRRLSPKLFGTEDDPKRTGAELVAAAKGPVKQLLQDLPILAGAPANETFVDDDGVRWLNISSPFSDNARITSGRLDVTYRDRQPFDGDTPPTQTDDQVELDVRFTDPAGHNYTLRLKTLFKPPIPFWETAGGVMVNAWHHGVSGTGTPLFPRAYTYGAFWALGDVVVDGDVTSSNHVVHFMTTEVTRDIDYRLVIDEELPLDADNTPAGQLHHTHGIVLPVRVTPDGPAFQPVQTGFTLPNGMTQPFIHIMFEQDRIVKGPYTD